MDKLVLPMLLALAIPVAVAAQPGTAAESESPTPEEVVAGLVSEALSTGSTSPSWEQLPQALEAMNPNGGDSEGPVTRSSRAETRAPLRSRRGLRRPDRATVAAVYAQTKAAGAAFTSFMWVQLRRDDPWGAVAWVGSGIALALLLALPLLLMGSGRRPKPTREEAPEQVGFPRATALLKAGAPVAEVARRMRLSRDLLALVDFAEATPDGSSGGGTIARPGHPSAARHGVPIRNRN